MKLDNDQIETAMKGLVDIACSQPARDEMMIRTVADLITNFLQNLNDIAYVAVCKEQRESSQ